MFFLVPDSYKRWRYPRAAPAQARIFHYGWVRSSEQMKEKVHRTHRHWSDKKLEPDIMAVDAAALRSFRGTHPSVMAERTNPAEGLFQPDPNHRLTRRERRHRWMMKIERMTGLDFSSRHFIPYGQFTIAGSKRPLPLPDPDDLAAPTPSA